MPIVTKTDINHINKIIGHHGTLVAAADAVGVSPTTLRKEEGDVIYDRTLHAIKKEVKQIRMLTQGEQRQITAEFWDRMEDASIHRKLDAIMSFFGIDDPGMR